MLHRSANKVLVLSLLGLLILVMVRITFSHGSMSDPISRVFQCYLEGPESPDTVVCSDMIENGGTQQLYDWNEINLGDAGGQHQALIPNGQLCSAGREKYVAFDEPRADWPRTILPAGGPYTFLYDAYVPHNEGYFELWVTKDGYDPNQPLAWDDIELFARIERPPLVDGNYVMDATLPNGKSGHHLIYSIWQRYDSPEAFYACSDVWFGSAPTPVPTAAPACTSPAWEPNQSYSGGEWVSHNNAEWRARWGSSGVEPLGANSAWRIRANCTSANGVVTPIPTATYPPGFQTPTFTPSPTHDHHMHGTATPTHQHVHGTATPPPAVSSYCAVDYDIVSQWGSGYQIDVTITNRGGTPIEGWDLTWTQGVGELFESGWNADFGASDGRMSASNPAGHWNGKIESNGGTVTFEFMGSHAGTVSLPTDFAVNGIACQRDGGQPVATTVVPVGDVQVMLPLIVWGSMSE